MLRNFVRYSLGTAALGCALGALACVETAPGGAAVGADGEERDPSEMLAVGDRAPQFEASDETGRVHRLADHLGAANVVLIFYPANQTPGCTAQLCAARDSWQAYQDAGVQVFGVNPADAGAHQRFAEKHGFPFPLLADTSGDMIRDYGARGALGITKRTVYGIDTEGVIVFAQRGMPDTETILGAFEG